MRRSDGTNGGMTLIEVIVAAAIMAVIAMTLWSSVGQTARNRDIVEDSHNRLHQVRVAFDLITRDLTSAYLSMHRAPNEATHDTIFVGEDGGSSDRLDFYSFTHQRRYFDAPESDQTEISYYLESDPEVSGQKNLYRRSSALLDLEAKEGGVFLKLIEGVEEFDLEYFDLPMNQWQDEWDTTQGLDKAGILPYHVRVRIVTLNRRGDKVAYGTQLPIPMRTAIWQQGFMPGPPLMVSP